MTGSAAGKMHRVEWTRRRRSVRLDGRRLAAVLERILAQGAFPGGVVSVAVVGDAEMRTLNAAHTQADDSTDVLAFPLADDDAEAGSPVAEIIINADAAAEAAARHGHAPARELALYAIHGALHLVGFDDAHPSDRRRMRRAETRCLALWDQP